MDKKGGDAAGSHRSNMSGDTVSARVLSDPEAVPDRHEKTEQSDHSDVSQPSSAPDKAEALPRKIWVLITAGLLVWTIIAIGAMLLFF